jgi:hypothetical protein
MRASLFGEIMIARIAQVALLMTGAALAAPPLTTIQDVLYKADGTRFNGMVVVSWNSFEAPDTSNITTQNITVKVTDGALRVQLVPTTASAPPVYYSVKYNSDGKVQFQETWSVPSSVKAVRVRDVRVQTPSGLQTDTANTGPFQESDITGLAADLAARPVKGAAFAGGRAVFANTQGALEAVAGDPGDCVRVDGSAGPCGGGFTDTTFVDGDTPAGIVDGNNTVFTLTTPPNPAGSLALYRNGILLKAVQDFSLANRFVTFVPALTPQPGDTLLASYRVATDSSGAPQPYPGPQVLCSGVGATTNSAASTNLGVCTVPAAVLAAGDRVEIRYDLEHQGTSAGFHFEVHWGATSIGQRDAPAGESQMSGRTDAGLDSAGARLSWQSWGSVLPFAAAAASASDNFADGITIGFFGQTSTAGGDTLALKNFTIIRFP